MQTQDYGFDPQGNGIYKMVPSGDLVDKTERDKRLSYRKPSQVKNDCLGLSWNQIEAMQGGNLHR